jgi:hypothetical protein
MTTLAQSMQAVRDWCVAAVTGNGAYPFAAEKVRWGTQDFPRADVPLVTIDILSHSIVSGPVDTYRTQIANVWTTVTRLTYEMTLRVECWTAQDRTQPTLDDRADVLLDRLTMFGATPPALAILDAGGVGLLRWGDIAAFDEIDGATTLRAASREVTMSRVAVALTAEDYVESVEITGTVDPMDPITFTVEP